VIPGRVLSDRAAAAATLASRQPAVGIARLVNTAFFGLTSGYCLLTYNAFAYRQFLKPRLIVWLTDFVAWHHVWYWLALGITALSMATELRGQRGPARWVGGSYLVVAALAGVALSLEPLMPQVENNWRGLLFAMLALLPLVWLAVYDHVCSRGRVSLSPSSLLRVFRGGLLAGALIWAVHSLWVPWRLDRTGDIVLSGGDVAFGMAVSAIAHLMASTAVALVAVLALGAVKRVSTDARLEYWMLALLAWAAIAAGGYRIVFAPLAFTGALAWFVASSFAGTLVLVWSGVARRLTTSRSAAVFAVDAWLSPLPGIRSPLASAVAFSVLVVLTFATIGALEGADWDFLMQKAWVGFFWAAATSYANGMLPAKAASLTWRSIAAPSIVAAVLFVGEGRLEPRLVEWARATRFVPDFILEGYVSADPSFLLLRDLLRVESADDAAFYRYLRANSTVQDADVQPVSVDFVPSFTASSGAPRPHIFVFVIDSLRRDYLSPYNPRVTFTPSIDRFAKDSVVFERAFTRYGGTGLSVPALWAGGMLFHKQYVTPFTPMNALMKLLDADGYVRVMSMDSVVAQLLPRDGALVELDRQTDIVDYDLCQTLDELQMKMEAGVGQERPIFAYSLPQNLHISRIRFKPAPTDSTYAGFFGQAAAQIQHMDGCFGTFVEALNKDGLYDNSLIVLTADHGDLLGEFRRWGHSYLMAPEIARIPLIVHLPPSLRERFAVDPTGVALSTDITPSLYALLGYHPADLGALFGRSLFHDRSEPIRPPADRPRLLASSYGAVYAVVRDQGRRLYVADGVNNREYTYDLSGTAPLRIGINPNDRAKDRGFIRQQLDELASLYRFAPEP